VDSGRAISFVTLGTRDLPTLRSFYRSWGWTERDGGDDEFAQFDAGGVRLALYPLGLLGDEAAPDRELPPEDAWNGVTLAINDADREAVDTSTPLPWRPALGSSVRPWTASGAATRATSPTRRATAGRSPGCPATGSRPSPRRPRLRALLVQRAGSAALR
jgi:hypothetical protein